MTIIIRICPRSRRLWRLNKSRRVAWVPASGEVKWTNRVRASVPLSRSLAVADRYPVSRPSANNSSATVLSLRNDSRAPWHRHRPDLATHCTHPASRASVRANRTEDAIIALRPIDSENYDREDRPSQFRESTSNWTLSVFYAAPHSPLFYYSNPVPAVIIERCVTQNQSILISWKWNLI